MTRGSKDFCVHVQLPPDTSLKSTAAFTKLLVKLQPTAKPSPAGDSLLQESTSAPGNVEQ